MTGVKCAEAQVVIALALLKTQDNVTIMSFTNELNELKPVNWTSKTTYEQAMESYKEGIVS